MKNISRAQVRKLLKLSLGEALAQERHRRGLSLKEVSFELKIPMYRLAMIEKGKIGQVWDCYKLAAFYGRRLRVILE